METTSPRNRKGLIKFSMLLMCEIIILLIGYKISTDYVWIDKKIYDRKITSLNLSFCDDLGKDYPMKISAFKNLEQLDIMYSSITDISFLNELEDLRRLEIGGRLRTNITDWTPLEDCCQLEYLRIWDTDFTYLTHIKNLSNLMTLDMLDGNNVTNIDDVVYLTNLKEIHLSSYNLTDITPLCQLQNIEKISVTSKAEELPDFSNCTKLKILWVGGFKNHPLRDIDCLVNSSIEELNLNYYVELDNKDVLWQIPQLSYLTIKEGVLTDDEIDSLRLNGIVVEMV